MASNDVIIRLMADVSSLQSGMQKAQAEIRGLKSTTEQVTSGIGSSFKKIGTALAGVFAVGKVKDFTMSMIEASAGVQALDSMFQQTFKGNQAEALGRITEQAKSQNINVDRLKGSWASFYGTFRGGGASANESLDMTTRYMKLAGDGSAYYDKSLEDVVSRLKSVTMGNFEAGDAIGLNLNATMLGQKATEMYGKKWQDLNQTQKEFLILNVSEGIYKNSGAMGQGAREANSWLNVTENLKATWQRFLGIIGQPILQVATSMVVGLTNAISGAISWVQTFSNTFNQCYQATGNFAEALASTFDSMNMSWAGDMVMALDGIIGKMKEVVNWFKEHKLVTQALTGVIVGLVVAYAGFKTAMGIVNGLKAMNSALETAQIMMLLFQDRLAGASLGMVLASGKALLWNTVSTIGATVTTAFGTAMAFLTSPIALVIGAIVGLVAVGYLVITNWDTVKAFLLACWDAIKSVAMSVWNGICTTISTIMTNISTVISSVWTAIQTAISLVLNIILAIVVSVWNLMVSAISVPLNIIYNIVMMIWNSIKGYVMTVVSGIASIISFYFNMYKTIITTILSIIASMVSTIWNGIKIVVSAVCSAIASGVSVAWNGIKTVIVTILTIIKSMVSTIWAGIKIVVSSACSAIKSGVSTAWNGIKTVIVTILTIIKSMVSTIWAGIKTVFSSACSAIHSIVGNKFNALKSKISGIMNSIKGTISSIWGRIKSIFNQVLKPNIKMPHIEVNGKFSLNPPSVPHFGISWHAKGGIATGASVVGVGEAGDEAIVPLSNKHRMLPFAEAVASLMPDNVKGSSDGGNVNINVSQLVVREEADVQRVAEQLYRLQERNKRARGKY